MIWRTTTIRSRTLRGGSGVFEARGPLAPGLVAFVRLEGAGLPLGGGFAGLRGLGFGLKPAADSSTIPLGSAPLAGLRVSFRSPYA